MTITKSYEALAADLASEKILSKTLIGQKDIYMMLADQRKFELDGAIHRESLSDKHLGLALEREAALRESLTDKREEYNKLGDRYDALQQRLTVAEQLLGEALCHAQRMEPISASLFNRIDSAIDAALKPAAEGEGS